MVFPLTTSEMLIERHGGQGLWKIRTGSSGNRIRASTSNFPKPRAEPHYSCETGPHNPCGWLPRDSCCFLCLQGSFYWGCSVSVGNYPDWICMCGGAVTLSFNLSHCHSGSQLLLMERAEHHWGIFWMQWLGDFGLYFLKSCWVSLD